MVGEGQPYSANEISQALQTPVAASLAWDPLAADVYAYGATPHRRHENSALLRSLRASHDPLLQLLNQRALQLRPTAIRRATPTGSTTSVMNRPASRTRPTPASRTEQEDARA